MLCKSLVGLQSIYLALVKINKINKDLMHSRHLNLKVRELLRQVGRT